MKNKQNFCFTKSKAYGLCGVVITISLFSTTQVNADETTSGTKPSTEQIASVVSETPTQKEISLTPYIKSVSQITRPTSTEVKITHTVTNTSSLTILSSNWYVPFATISPTDLTPLKWSNEKLGFLYPENKSKVPVNSLLKIVDSTNSLNTNLLEYVERGNNEGLLYNAKPEIINLSTDKVARINIGRLNPGETVVLSYTFCITDPSGNLINNFAYNIASYKYGVVKAANITANYVDEQGNTISDNVVLNGNVGDTYTTEQKAIPGYTFKEIQGSASGQFTDKEQTVTYVYTKDPVVGGNVTAKYVDGAGNTLSDNVVKSGNIGDDYSTEKKAIPGYTFKEVQGSASGQFTDKEQTITYVYTKDPVAGANVTAKYVDENGKTISDDVVKNGNVGDSYTTEQKAIPGYTFKEIQGSASGQFTDKEQTVTYVYTKDPVVGGSVLVKYVDEAGNTLSDNVVKSGNIGDDYSTEQKAIPGYTFKEVQGSASGQFTDQEQTITYVYTKDPVAGANVTVKYVDGAGNTLSDNVVKSGNIGDDYSTEQKAIPGYTFKEVQGSASGRFTDQEEVITYVYTKDPVAGANVTVKYVDGAGNTLSDNVVKSGNIGDDYSTEQKAIPGYTFKEVQGSASGQFTDQEQTVTYVYTKDPVAGANVTAKYVDENGKTISDDVVKNGNIGDDYSTEQKAIPGYTFKEVQGSASGQFTDQEQTVTYVYTKNAPTMTTEKKTVNETVSYVDQNGHEVATKHTASVDFTRQVSTDAVTGEKTYGNWSADQSFDAVKSPELKGYTADKAQIDKQTVNGDSKDLEFTVTYRSNDKPVITAPNQDYKVGDSIDPLKNVTASDKEDGTTKVTVAKIVDQDGKVIDSIPNDKAGKYTVTYTTTDADGNTVTKDATISVRSNDKPVITAPNQDYKVGDSIDPLKNVTASDKEDGTTKVTVAKIVDQDGKVIDSIPNDKAGKYTVTYTTTDADGNTVTKDATISVRSNEKPGNGTDNGNPSSNQPGNPSQPSNATNNGVINTSTNIGSKVNNGAVNSPELPQTGENNRQSQTMSFIGVLLAMFGSLLGFLGIKKRRND